MMQNAIEEALKPLIGLPLLGATRACNLETLQFGEYHLLINEEGLTRTVSTWVLNIQCAWRIRDSKKIIAASTDCYIRADHVSQSDENFHWDVAGQNQRDQRMKDFMKGKENTLRVENAFANNVGDLCLKLSSDYYLEVFSDFSAEDREYWRLFQPGMESPHFVVTTLGIENDI